MIQEPQPPPMTQSAEPVARVGKIGDWVFSIKNSAERVLLGSCYTNLEIKAA